MYARSQLEKVKMLAQITIKEYIYPFKGSK